MPNETTSSYVCGLCEHTAKSKNKVRKLPYVCGCVYVVLVCTHTEKHQVRKLPYVCVCVYVVRVCVYVVLVYKTYGVES